MKKFVIIDGHHLIFRAFYGIGTLTTRNGDPSNALFGFASMLINILNQENPNYLAIAFDVGKTFRHEADATYKGTRKEQPDELKVQIPQVMEMVKRMNVPIYTAKGFEADDVIGTLAYRAVDDNDDMEVTIVSGDRDLLQLVQERIRLSLPPTKTSEPEYLGVDEVYAKYGVWPEQIPDYKGIIGDPADNIKGVNGVGPKTAVKLLQEYKDIDGVYDNIEELKGAVKTKMEKDCDSAKHSKYLATIVTDVELDCIWSDMEFGGVHNGILDFFQEWDFYSLQRRIKPWLFDKEEVVEKNNDQMSMF